VPDASHGPDRPAPAPESGAGRTGVDLNEQLNLDPGRTLLLRVCGDSMVGAGIRHGDLLVVDRNAVPRPGRIVVALLEGGFTLKRLVRRGAYWWLEAAHPAYPPLPLGGSDDERLWGVALHVIRSLPGGRWPRPRS
jgi:DNA polymerase V